MKNDTSRTALRNASPRKHPDFDHAVQRYRALGRQIVATPVPVPRPLMRPKPRHRAIALSASAAAVITAAAVVGLLVVTTAPPQSALAAARKAIAATSAARSGTLAMTVRHGDATRTLDTTRWSGHDISLSDGKGLGPNRQFLLIGGGVYVQTADGTWRHYASEAEVGPKLGPAVQLAHDNVAGTTADQILKLATDLRGGGHGPNGTTLYKATIPNNNGDPALAGTDDSILRVIASLRSGNERGAPGGHHNDLHFELVVGRDGFVRWMSLSYHQEDTGLPTRDGTYVWTVSYSGLGTTGSITPPSTFTETRP